MQEAYIVAGLRTAVGKAPRGAFRFTRPDDLAVEVIKQLLTKFPQLEKERVEDLIVGNAVPEAEQGLQIGRQIAVRALGLNTQGVFALLRNSTLSSSLWLAPNSCFPYHRQ